MDGREAQPGWRGVNTRAAAQPDAFGEWYEAWRARYSAQCAREEAERARLKLEIRWMTGLIAAWSLVMGGAAILAIWIVL